MSEHVGQCAAVWFGEGTAEAKSWRDAVCGHLWEGRPDSAFSAVEQLSSRSPGRREAKHALITYLTNNRQRLDYPRYRALGVPCGSGEVEAWTVDFTDEEGKGSRASAKLRSDWPRYGEGIPLRVVESTFRTIVEPVVAELDRIRRNEPEYNVTVILPEFITAHWWENLLHNQTALRLKAVLMNKPKVVVISIPYHLEPDKE